MHPEKIFAEAHWNRDKRDGLEYMRVVQNEETRANRVHQQFIVLYHGNLKGAELYAV